MADRLIPHLGNRLGVFRTVAGLVLLLSLSSCVTDGQVSSQGSPILLSDIVKASDNCDIAQIGGRRLTCGNLVVPENRSHPGGAKVELPYIVMHANEQRHPDPIVFINGGPSSVTIGTTAQTLAIWDFEVQNNIWIEGRDLIIFEQRGTGAAKPLVNCPKQMAKMRFDGILPADFQLMRDCREAVLQKTNNPQSYNAVEIAADVHDLRRHLGIGEWNLWGESYGSRIAQEMIRQSEEGIRSAILGGVLSPADYDPFLYWRSFVFGLRHLFRICWDTLDCRESYGDLEATLNQVLADLRTQPVIFRSYSITNEKFTTVEMSDTLFLTLLFWQLYTHSDLFSVPFIIDQASKGKFDRLIDDYRDSLVDWKNANQGLALLVICNDEGAPKPSYGQNIEASQGIMPLMADWVSQYDWLAGCSELTPKRKRAIPSELVSSDLPVLMVVGDLDPTTPSYNAQEVYQELEKSYWYQFSYYGHDATAPACGQRLIKTFINNLDPEMPEGCWDELASYEFKLPDS